MVLKNLMCSTRIAASEIYRSHNDEKLRLTCCMNSEDAFVDFLVTSNGVDYVLGQILNNPDYISLVMSVSETINFLRQQFGTFSNGIVALYKSKTRDINIGSIHVFFLFPQQQKFKKQMLQCLKLQQT